MLDVMSCILVFEVIKLWHQNMNTIVITYDLSQIDSEDFVYMLKDGTVAEQGYHNKLKSFPNQFSQVLLLQSATRCFQEKVEEMLVPILVEVILEQQDMEKQEELEDVKCSTRALKHQSVVHSTATR
ncbi:hypothetical protein SCP_0802440 [Sparassis crispa]|uniref:Uncharacterized protein n=1 Tax=Sparassis crispa TaxID=139825 RepID=A0A401GU21_9APHY|nr:hypothetical protein SCP_0802440 [Sparassis crispa]GBE85722.1 hypothetical protein SCP_0802440 [Sparassis crispa]